MIEKREHKNIAAQKCGHDPSRFPERESSIFFAETDDTLDGESLAG